MLYADKKDIDRLWENVAVWEMYMQRGDYEKILHLDKSFHAMVYEMCGRTYWHELVESISPHFDRTTVLSLQCRPTDKILSDHKNLVEAIEKKMRCLPGRWQDSTWTAIRKTLTRFISSLMNILQNDGSYSSLRAVIFYGVRWQSAVHENVQYSKTLVKKYQCGIMCIVKLAVGYIVFEQKQIVILADEKSAAEWRRLVCRFMYWEIQS